MQRTKFGRAGAAFSGSAAYKDCVGRTWEHRPPSNKHCSVNNRTRESSSISIVEGIAKGPSLIEEGVKNEWLCGPVAGARTIAKSLSVSSQDVKGFKWVPAEGIGQRTDRLGGIFHSQFEPR